MATRTPVKFEVVDREDVPPRSWQSDPAPHTVALAEGKTLFVPGRTGVSTSKSGYLYRNGFKLRQRRGERNGTRGVYLWTERNGTAPRTS